MTKNSRRKGADGEREIAKILRDHGYDARRGCQFKGGPDSPDVIGLPGIHIEVKRVESLNIYNAMDQSCCDAGPMEIPVVFHRKNNRGWLVTMGLDDWINLYAESRCSNAK